MAITLVTKNNIKVGKLCQKANVKGWINSGMCLRK